MIVRTFAAGELFRIKDEPPVPGNPSWMNLSIKPVSSSHSPHLRGPGLYACFHDGRLFYVGKYRGRGANPFSGNIASTRWDKHLGTFTMRGRKVSVSPGNVAAACALEGLALATDLRKADGDTLARDRGMKTSLKRVRFAAHHWDSFAAFDNSTLDRFTYVYAQVDPADAAGRSIEEIRAAVSAAEKAVISAIHPFGNNETKTALPLADVGPDQVGPLLTASLEKHFSQPSVQNASAPGQANETSTSVSADDELTPKFLTILSEDAEQLIEALQARIEADAPELEIYFTETGGGDLRVRLNSPNASSRTLLTMQWKKSVRSLQCQTPLSHEQCVAVGFEPALVRASSDSVMNSVIELGANDGQASLLFDLVRATQKKFEA